jgi:predicted TIM-barrel fold metal-dependent hydrolase
VNKSSFRIGFVALVTALIARAAPQQAQQRERIPAPLADHHQHLFSPAIAALISPPPPAAPVTPIDAHYLITLLDAAGIRRAAVLSVAYIYGQPGRNVENEYEKVKAENDWTSREVARYRDRLRGFCGLNPLKDYALTELSRCAKDTNLRYGLKLHFGNSAIDYHNPQHVQQLRRVFRAANDNRMPIIIHMRASISQKLSYGRDEAIVFLNEILPAAPDVAVQIAHLAGAGGYADPLADQALSVFVEAIEKGDPRTKRLWFDVTSVALPSMTTDQAALIAKRIRQLGVQRVVYGSDAASGGNLAPREGWAEFLKVPLSNAEFLKIATNVPPYMR